MDLKTEEKSAGPIILNLKEIIPIITKYSTSFPLGSFLVKAVQLILIFN